MKIKRRNIICRPLPFIPTDDSNLKCSLPPLIHMNEYIDLKYSDELSRIYNKGLYRLCLLKNMDIPIMYDGYIERYTTKIAGTIGGLVSGTHNLNFDNGVVWVDYNSMVVDSSVICKGEIRNSFILGDTKLDLNYHKFNNVSVNGKFVINLKKDINYAHLNLVPYMNQMNDMVLLNGNGDIMQISNPFSLDYGKLITIYDPNVDIQRKRDMISNHVLDCIMDDKPNDIEDTRVFYIVDRIVELCIDYFNINK